MIVTPETHQRARVYLDGQDVSTACFYADDVGVVRLYKRNDRGNFYVLGTKADPNWQPEWPEHRMYRNEGGRCVEVLVCPNAGDIATEERHGAVRIELPQ